MPTEPSEEGDALATPASDAPHSPLPALPTRTPSLRLPPGACDTHIHVFGDPSRYPLAAARHYTPASCSLEQYRRLAHKLGVMRAVLVQPSVYAFDNGALLDALKSQVIACRGVVVIGADTSDAILDQLHGAGVRGVRANLVNSNGLSASGALQLAPRLRVRGWHLQLQIAIDTFSGLSDFVAQAGLPVVVDHFGLPTADDPERGPFRELRRLVERGLCWVKLSAHYRLAGIDATVLVRALVGSNPHRLLWGSDWPHPGLGSQPMPDDVDSVDALGDWLPDETLRRQVLVENPSLLYWS